MTIQRTGVFVEIGDTYRYGFSDAAGALRVADGSQLQLTGGTTGPEITVGTPGAGPAAGLGGTLTVEGMGSRIDLIANGNDTFGARVFVGLQGATGVFQVLDGAAFRMTDPTGITGSNVGGDEIFIVGDGSVAPGVIGRGTVEVRGSELTIEGTGAFMGLGLREGQGEARFTADSQVTIRSTSHQPTDFAGLRAGDRGGEGSVTIADSFVLVEAGRFHDVQAEVGRRGGEGTLSITGTLVDGAPSSTRDGLFVVGNAHSQWAGFRVGFQDGAVGTATVGNGGALAVVNMGLQILPGAGTQPWVGTGPLGGDASMQIGRQTGTGSLTLENTSEAFVGGRTFTDFSVGFQDGIGTAHLTNSRLRVTSTEQTAAVRIGSEGGEGTLGLTASRLELTGGEFAHLGVGSSWGAAGGVGQMTLAQSTVEVRTTLGGIDLEIGRNAGGSGTLVATGSTITLAAPTTGDRDTSVWVHIGNESGTGSVTLEATTLEADATHRAGIRVGTRWTHTPDTSGDGTLILRNGAAIDLETTRGKTEFWAGGGAGSRGVVEVRSGSRIDMGTDGWMAVGLAADWMTPPMAPGGLTGTMLVDGAGSIIQGMREMSVGHGGSSGELTVSDGARVFVGGLGSTRNAYANFGHGPGSNGTLTMTNSAMVVQAGARDASQSESGASADFGTRGGVATARISGQLGTNPDAQHGFGVVGSGVSDYAHIEIGRHANSYGEVVVDGAIFGASNAGIAFLPTLETVSTGGGSFAGMSIGRDGGTGRLEVMNAGQLLVESRGNLDGAHIFVGRGAGSIGSLVLERGAVGTIEARRGTATDSRDAYLTVGGQGGGQGSVVVNASTLTVTSDWSAGIRIGTSWFTEPDQFGTGSMTATSGARVVIASPRFSNFIVGGSAGSQAQALISEGAQVELQGAGNRLVIVGGSPNFVTGTGGQGVLSVAGAGSALTGANNMFVGFNAGNGSVSVVEGGQIRVTDVGPTAGSGALLGVGVGRVQDGAPVTGGLGTLVVDSVASNVQVEATGLARLTVGSGSATGIVTISNGARVEVTGAFASAEIGIDGGFGVVEVLGNGSRLSIAGGDGRMHIGRLLYDGGYSGEPGAGRVWVGAGATLAVHTSVEVGDAGPNTAGLVMAGGTLVTPLVTVHAGPTVAHSGLLGFGHIQGEAGTRTVAMSGSAFRIGDGLTRGGEITTGTGTLQVTGHVVKQGGQIHFDIGTGASTFDQLVVAGSFGMNGGEFGIQVHDRGQSLLGGARLISASGGIALNNVTFDFGGQGSEFVRTELRAGGTELWAVLDSAPPPPPPPPLPVDMLPWLDWIGGVRDAPDVPWFRRPANNNGDPHLVTFDGVAYSFHAAGEFVLMRPTAGTGFEVQSRMMPVAANASENMVMAVRLAGGAVVIDAATPDSILVNGEARQLLDGEFVRVGTDLVYRSGNAFHAVHRHGNPEGDAISVASAVVVDGRLDITLALDDSLQGAVEGLLGNFDGNQGNDLVLPDGTPLTQPLVFGDDPATGQVGLYGAFRDAWRVSTTDQSLFTYGPGEGPDSFYLPDYPPRMQTLDDFAADDLAAAQATATAAGLVPGTVAFNNAVFDLLATGNDSYVAAARVLQEKIEIRPDTAPVVAPVVEGGALQGLVSLSGRVLDLGDDALAGVRVTLTGTGQSVGHIRTTGANGTFGFEVLPNASGARIELTREFNPITDGPITATDALDVLRLAVGLAPSFGAAPAEALIAADIDRSGTVTATDALEVLRAAVGLTPAAAPRWMFLDQAADLSGLAAGSVSYETGVALAPFADPLSGLDMRGILLGQMSAFA